MTIPRLNQVARGQMPHLHFSNRLLLPSLFSYYHATVYAPSSSTALKSKNFGVNCRKRECLLLKSLLPKQENLKKYRKPISDYTVKAAIRQQRTELVAKPRNLCNRFDYIPYKPKRQLTALITSSYPRVLILNPFRRSPSF